MREYVRQDIQFLRGWAVSIVVLEHAGVGPSAGYLGVDIFFVISGYLITRLLQTRLESGTFSFREFYTRRAKRLLPAAYATFFLTALAAPYFLSDIQLHAFGRQLFGALTFTANIILYRQSGYFDTAAAQKPLLHIWSLSLEEQYYILVPLLLFFVPRRLWTHATLLMLVASFGLCMLLLAYSPRFAFYSLPTRAWELCFGSLVALTRLDVHQPKFMRWIFWPSAIGVLVIPFFPTGLPHPGLDAAIVCLCTAVIIINGRQFFGRAYPLRATAWVGDGSYSIYLAHWPIMAFLNNAYLREVPFQTRSLSLLLTIVFGFALYYLVERPIHKSNQYLSLSMTLLIAVPAAALVVAPLFLTNIVRQNSPLDFREIRRPNVGFDIACDQRHDLFRPLAECISGDNPTVMVWGDSLAMHLVQGINASKSFNFIQATRRECPPVFGYAQYNNNTETNHEWARRCIDFNESIFQYLTKNEEVGTVIIGSTFLAFTFDSPWRAIVLGRGDEFQNVEIDHSRSVRVLSSAIRSLRSIGKRVVIFAPPPGSRVDYSECIEREATGRITFGMSGCSMPVGEDGAQYGNVLKVLHDLADSADVEIVDPRDWMCTDQVCETVRNGMSLYRDRLHLSNIGSEILGSEFGWGDRIILLSK